MNLAEFFAGSRSVGKEAEKLDMDVFSTDIEDFEDIDYVVDILKFDVTKLPFIPDVGWFSTPCPGFSVASIGKNWTGGKNGYIPKSDSARMSIALAEKTIELIKYFISINPDFIFWVENPRGLLRKMPFMQEFPRYTVWYCTYGDDRAKPTDIWTNCKNWNPHPVCHNGNKNCHHEPAPRGSKTGTQGRKGSYERSKIPSELCREILMSCKVR